MFCNRYNHSIDDKGRLIIPMEYRPDLVGSDMTQAKPFYITTNLWDPNGKKEPCLCLWPEEDFFILRDKLRGVSDADPKNRRIKRKFFSNTQTTTLDKQGRILVIADLKQYANIEKNVMLVGMDNHLELWDYDAWKCYNDDEDDDDEASWTGTLSALGM
jgi:MraZ protein